LCMHQITTIMEYQKRFIIGYIWGERNTNLKRILIHHELSAVLVCTWAGSGGSFLFLCCVIPINVSSFLWSSLLKHHVVQKRLIIGYVWGETSTNLQLIRIHHEQPALHFAQVEDDCVMMMVCNKRT
jgi:hypothetical protein